MPKNKWKLVSKKGKNFENLFITLVALGLAPSKKPKLTPTQLVGSKYLQVSNNRYFLQTELDQHIAKLKKFIKEKTVVLFREYQYYQKILMEMKQFVDGMPIRNFQQLKLIDFLEKWGNYISLAIQYAYNYYFLNQPIAEVILKALKRSKSNDIFADFEILSQAKELSVIQKEKIDLLKLVKRLKADKLSLASKLTNKAVLKHLKKYAYMGMFYFRGRPWQKADVVKRIKDWFKADWQTELKKIQHQQKADILTDKLIKKYKFTTYETQLIKLMKEIAYSTNYYDEVHNYYAYKSQPLLKYLARKIGVTYKELIEINYLELINLLKSNKKASPALKRKLQDRDKDSAMICIKGKIKVIQGPEVNKFFQKEIGQEKIANQNILKGQSASKGKAKGKVIIFRSVADIPKVKRGDIMVAACTVPSFVPAMEKAAAIVTEMGGLLSHAAIVSRELNIPCVVGVDNVTKILKDSDEVEVDATHGIIKKLS